MNPLGCCAQKTFLWPFVFGCRCVNVSHVCVCVFCARSRAMLSTFQSTHLPNKHLMICCEIAASFFAACMVHVDVGKTLYHFRLLSCGIVVKSKVVTNLCVRVPLSVRDAIIGLVCLSSIFQICMVRRIVFRQGAITACVVCSS